MSIDKTSVPDPEQVIPDPLDNPSMGRVTRDNARLQFRAPKESFVQISTPVDHAALYAALEALHSTFPHLLIYYRTSTLPLMLEHMLVFYGVQEIHGPLSSEIIGGWITELGGAAGPVQDDNAEWCCIPTALACQRCGYPLPMPHASWSRRWATWGASVSSGDERLGDVVVLSRGRPEAEKGHLGLAVKWEAKYVAVLGGNTQDAVRVGWYERGERILAVRRPDPQWEEAVPWPSISGLAETLVTT